MEINRDNKELKADGQKALAALKRAAKKAQAEDARERRKLMRQRKAA